MEEWKERLLEEHKQLKERLVKLIEFLNSEKYFTFDDNTKAVFNRQRTGMEIYLSALNIRVFGKPEEHNVLGDIMPLFLMNMIGSSYAYNKSSEDEFKELIDKIPVKNEGDE